MINTERCLELLQKIENRSYRGKERVIVTLEDVANLTDLFEELTPDDQELVKGCVSEKAGKILISFTGDMARKAVETSDSRWLNRALITHILEDVRFDDRENLRELFLLNPAFEALGEDKNQLWDSYGALSSDRVKRYLVNRH